MAALDFPNTPSNGDTYSANGLTYTYNSSNTKWVRTSPSVGAQGAQGHQGAAGAQGAQGHQGATAAAGAQGAQGAQGHQGAGGSAGAQGAQGHQGAGGSAGAQGNQGYQGAAGPAGAQGHQGSAGSATITGNADNRVITGGSGTNLNGESTLTYNGNQLRIGTSSNLALWGQNNRLQVAGNDWPSSGVSIAKMGNSGSSPNLVFGSGRGSSPGTVIQDGDRLGYISFTGDDGTDLHTVGAAIVVDVSGTISSNSIPGRIRFYTGSNGADYERLRIETTGHSFFNQSVGIQTADITGANISNPVGAGHSLVGLYIGDGSLMFSSALSRSGGYYISTDINALNAGPVTLNSNMKLDGTWVIV